MLIIRRIIDEIKNPTEKKIRRIIDKTWLDAQSVNTKDAKTATKKWTVAVGCQTTTNTSLKVEKKHGKSMTKKNKCKKCNHYWNEHFYNPDAGCKVLGCECEGYEEWLNVQIVNTAYME